MEIRHIIYTCIALYYLYRYIDNLFDPDKVTKKIPVKKKILYLVNGREVDVPHHIYYQQMLGLSGNNKINDDTIRESSLQKLNEIDINNPNEPSSDALDIKAANLYILDEWNYFIRWN